MTLWLDIDDLLVHLIRFNRPSGIQRVVYEAGAALRRTAGQDVQFLRRGQGPFDFRVVAWDAVQAAFRLAMERESHPPVSQAPPRASPHLGAVPGGDGDPLLPGMVRAQARAVGAVAGLTLGVIRIAGLQGSRAARKLFARPVKAVAPVVSVQERLESSVRFADLVRPGDVFLTLGSPWHHEDYIRTIRWLCHDLRVRFALLIHDLVPLRHPEWCDRGIILTFRSWHREMFPMASAVFTLSNATARDVGRYLEEQAIVVPKGISAVPAGTICNLTSTPMSARPIVEGRYVLFVSTIEARKNHTLLFRVWRRLLAELPADEVPTLVFAGREGWLVADLMRQLDNTDWLDGRIRFVRNPSDADLHRLYADCLFTVFPSLFEGWGLPVTESLGMGRPCIASNTTSIPEAGGTLARYFNPYDLHDAYRMIRDAILDRDGLARWTETVRAEFRPVPWDHSASAILQTLEIPGFERTTQTA
ncbi:glycosyltransferase family 4 protein [Lichenicola sp.]|uniref:glycosyltransferase family 4 protein n=1 Tax=Lichenicola sp. TaxID=2804529 RepID=UPI003AFFEB31